jgi:hypothetical protein
MKKIGLLIGIFLMLLTSCTTEPYEGNVDASVNLLSSLPNDVVIIDFEEFVAGDIVSTTSPNGCDGSIGVMALNPNFPANNSAMAFDSANPSGGDDDLGTPNESFGGPGISSEGPQPSNDTSLGMVLIISEDLDSSDPDDSYVAGSNYSFDFSSYADGSVTLIGFDMLDLDAPGANDLPTVVSLYDAANVLLLEKEVPYGPDNAKQFVDLESTTDVVRMVIGLNNSGAIDNIMFTCEDKEIELGGCETMFAKANDNAFCFIDDQENNFNRWGWTNGPLSSGTYEFAIWAGAGQCDTDKGTMAGTVTLVYDSLTGIAEVTYATNGDYVLTETHLYIGNGPYPLKKKGKNYVPTVAPGQFPYKHGNLDNVFTDKYPVDGLSGEIYIIAHGVVCEIIK